MPKTRVIGLGDARIETPVGTINPTAPTVFAAALFLALERNRQVSRDELSELLWPSTKKAARNHRLRQLILRLRASGFPVETDRSRQLRVPTGQLVSDGEEFIGGDTACSAADLYWLRGYFPEVSERFSEWLDETRTRLHASLAAAAMTKVSEGQAKGHWADVEVHSRRVLDISPFHETAAIALAEAMSMRGDTATAHGILVDFEERSGTSSPQVTAMRLRLRQVDKRQRNTPRLLPLIGRGPIVRILKTSLDAAIGSQGESCFLLGTAGIGKSRVMIEASEVARLKGFSVIQIQCRDGHQRIPLAASVQLAEMVKSLPGALGCAPETFSLLDRLTRHDPKQSADAGFSADSAWVFFSVRRAIFDALDAVADEQPLLITIEDAHWLDNASATLIADVIAWSKTKQISVVLTGRDLPVDWAQSLPNGLEVVAIGPLADADAHELLKGLLRNNNALMAENHAAWCVTVAEGNPYHLTELANHWIETGLDHKAPPSLSDVLVDRVTRLAPDALQLLQAIALLENESTLPRIEAVLQSPTHELLRNIDNLGRADMVSTSTSNTDVITTKHDLLSLAALDQLSTPARKLLHRSIAKVLEGELDTSLLASRVWSCAKHWQASGDQTRALHLVKACCDHLLKVGLLPDAAKAYHDGLAFCGTDQQRLDMYNGQLAACYHMSEWNRVKAIDVALNPIRARLCLRAVQHDDYELMTLRAQWHTVEWSSIFRRSMECLDSPDAPASHKADAGVMALIALTYERQSDMHSVFDRLETLFLAPSVKESTRCFATMVYHVSAGDVNEAVRAARLLVREEVKNNDLGNLFRAYCNAGVTFRVGGLFDEAESVFRLALSIADNHKLLVASARVLALMGALGLETGNFELTRECMHRLEAVTAVESNEIDLWDCKSLRVRVALIEGRLAEARQNLPTSLEVALNESSIHARTYSLALHAAVQLCAGETISQTLIDGLADSFKRSKQNVHQAFAACTLAKTLERSGNALEGRRLLLDYEVNSRREPWPVPEHLKNFYA